jgi:hypothetical protein
MELKFAKINLIYAKAQNQIFFSGRQEVYPFGKQDLSSGYG